MERIFQHESDVVEFILENVNESNHTHESVESFLQTLPDQIWQAVLMAYESVIRDELRSLIADAVTEEEAV